MSTMFDRLAQGAGGLSQTDLEQWKQSAGSAPAQQFGQAVTTAIKQVPAEEYYAHTEPGVSGTDPFAALNTGDLSGLAGTILGALAGKGVTAEQVGQQTGVPQIDPGNINPDQMAQVVQWLQQNHPEIFGQVAQQYQQQPDILHSLLGNKALMAAAVALGAKYMNDHYKPGMGITVDKKK